MCLKVLSPLRFNDQPFVHRSIVGCEPNVYYIVADSTPTGLAACTQFIEQTLLQQPLAQFKRLRFPYAYGEGGQTYYLPADHQLSCADNDQGVAGRLRWYRSNDLSEFEFEPITTTDSAEDLVEWPTPYQPTLDHLRSNAQHGSLIYTVPQLIDGLTVVQRWARSVLLDQQNQTIHEVACRCVSRYDLPMSVALNQVMALCRSGLHLLQPFRKEMVLLLKSVDLPYHLLQNDLDMSQRRVLREWVLRKCEYVDPPIHVSSTDRQWMIGPRQCRYQSPTDLFEQWFKLKIDQVLEERKKRVDAMYNPTSLEFKKRTWTHQLYVPNSQLYVCFFNKDKAGKRAFLEGAFVDATEDEIDVLMNLPACDIGRDVYQDLTFDRSRLEDDDPLKHQTEPTKFIHMTGRELYKQHLLKTDC
jgi:hypothetical protein